MEYSAILHQQSLYTEFEGKTYHSRLSLHKITVNQWFKITSSICRSAISLIALNKKINKCIF